ncbi:MAG: PQQ-binding-like beta-propeller repeat protein [Planctomycetota bacterium]
MTAETDPSSEYVSPENPRPKPSLKYGWIVLGIALLITVVAQYFAPQFDYQNANMIGLASCTLAGAFFLFCLQRRSAWSGHPWRVPIVVVGLGIAAAVCFRIDGFSGEMIPQIRFRFAQQPRFELKEVSGEPDVLTQIPDGDEAATDIADDQSPQFLGPNRNGVYDRRRFSIPSSSDEVEVLWNQGIGEGWSSFAVADGQAITLEQRDDQECLTCYRLSDGELLWVVKHTGYHQHPLGGVGPRSTPTINGRFVYATTPTGQLWCVDREDGSVIWEKDLLELAGWDQPTFESTAPWGYSISPLLTNGLCIVALGGPLGLETSASLIAFSSEDGEEVWRNGTDQLSYASPMRMRLGGVAQVVSVNEASVTGHAILSGETLWTVDWPGSTNTGANCAAAMAFGDNRLVVGKGYGGGSLAIEVTKSEDDWQTQDLWTSSRVLKTKFNHTCVLGNVGFGISNGLLQAVELSEANAYWTQPRRSRAAEGHVVLVEDTLLVQDEAGDVVFVDAETSAYNERLRLEALSSKTWNIPTVAGRHVLVRNDRQAICFRLPARSSEN